MDAEPLYCAEQIRVPDVLPDVLKQWTKEVIRQNPSDVLAFSAKCVRAPGGQTTAPVTRTPCDDCA